MSMLSALVPRIRTPARASRRARLFGTCPPMLTTTASGRSLSQRSSTLSKLTSSKTSRSHSSQSVLTVSGL